VIKFNNYYNVAICFSGQLRTCEHAAKNILRFFTPPDGCTIFDRPVRTDYFMHTWNHNTWRLPKKHHHHFEILAIDDNDIDFMRHTFKLKDFKVGDFEKYPNSAYAWDPLFYSFDQSMILKRDYELNHGFEYDLVIKIRPDIVYDISGQQTFPFENLIEPGVIYTPNTPLFPREFLRPNLDDVIFFGDSPTMDMVSTMWRSITVARNELGVRDPRHNECENPDILNHLGPGTLIHRHIISTGLSYAKTPPAFNLQHSIIYAVLRRTATDLNLDSVEDIKEILQIGREWYI
jgi:hypothetical protein